MKKVNLENLNLKFEIDSEILIFLGNVLKNSGVICINITFQFISAFPSIASSSSDSSKRASNFGKVSMVVVEEFVSQTQSPRKSSEKQLDESLDRSESKSVEQTDQNEEVQAIVEANLPNSGSGPRVTIAKPNPTSKPLLNVVNKTSKKPRNREITALSAVESSQSRPTVKGNFLPLGKVAINKKAKIVTKLLVAQAGISEIVAPQAGKLALRVGGAVAKNTFLRPVSNLYYESIGNLTKNRVTNFVLVLKRDFVTDQRRCDIGPLIRENREASQNFNLTFDKIEIPCQETTDGAIFSQLLDSLNTTSTNHYQKKLKN